MISLKRSVIEPGHRMLTIGVPRYLAVRITMGRLARGGVWHAKQPCIMILLRGRRL